MYPAGSVRAASDSEEMRMTVPDGVHKTLLMEDSICISLMSETRMGVEQARRTGLAACGIADPHLCIHYPHRRHKK